MTVDRNENAIPVSSGYSMDLYCCVCLGDKYEPSEMFEYRSRIINQISADGPNCYKIVRWRAKKIGWILHNDGYATCPRCNPKLIKPN